MPPRPILEVCVASYAEAVTAHSCGADRIELNSALQLGGLTPTASTVQRIIENVSIDVIAMSRPRPGGFCYSHDDWTTLVADSQWMIDQGVHGIAFGCLTPERIIDESRVSQIREQVGDRQLVFHRAFDLVEDWREGLDILIRVGVDRVMTSGGAESVPDGLLQISEVVDYAAGRIEVIPAGGITPSNVRNVLLTTQCDQVHGTFSAPAADPGYEDACLRFSPVDQVRMVCSDKLREVMESLKLLPE